jgi:hypothetical protein
LCLIGVVAYSCLNTFPFALVSQVIAVCYIVVVGGSFVA